MDRGRIAGGALRALPCAVCLNLLPSSAWADWSTSTQARLTYDNNVGNAQSADDIVADWVTSATASVYQLFPFGDRYSVTVLGNAAGDLYHQVHGLSNASLGGTLSLRRRWGLGALAPWARLGLQAARSDYRDDYRNRLHPQPGRT